MRIRPVHNGQGKDHEKNFPCTLFTTITFPSLYSGSFNHFWTLNKTSPSPASAKEGFFLSLDQNYFTQLFCSGSLGTQI